MHWIQGWGANSKPRVELPYNTYLIAWFMMHYLSLMTSPPEDSSGGSFIQRHGGSDWRNHYMRTIRKTMRSHQNYHIYRYFPDFFGRAYGEKFWDTTGLDGYITLSSGCFLWLINIRSGHLLYCQGSICLLEPYFSSRFARQFGYSQLYVGNSNTLLQFQNNLFEGAKEWFHFFAGCTGAHFVLSWRLLIFTRHLDFALGTIVPTP